MRELRASRLCFALATILATVTVVSSCGDSTGPGFGPAAKLAFTAQPSNVVAGAAIAPTVQVVVQDAQGNSVTTSTASVTLAITSGTGTSGGVLGGTATVAAVNGVATFSTLTVDKAASGYTLTAAAGVLTSAVSNTFTVSHGTAAKLAFSVQPTNVTRTFVIIPGVQVKVQDAWGNTVPTATTNVTLAVTTGTGTSGASLGGNLTVAAMSGVATFGDLTVDKLGTGYTLTATAGGLTSATSASFTVTEVVVAVVAASDTLAGVGSTLTLVAQTRDVGGFPLSGKTFTWASLNPSAATVDPTTGVVTAVTSGQVTISATTEGVAGYALVTISMPSAPVVSLWETQAVSARLSDVWGTSMTEAWAVGDIGTILRYNGTTWTAQSSGTSNFLYGVWGTGASDVFAVGAGGTILHYDGTAWQSQASGVSATLRHVWGSSPRDVYAVGDGGTIVHYNGASWSGQYSGTTNTLYGVWGSSSTNVLAVGGPPGTIVRSDGSTWTLQPAFSYGGAFSGTHFAVWGVSRNFLYLPSSMLTIYTSSSGYTGLNGNSTGWGTPGDFHAMWGASNSRWWVVSSDSWVGGGGNLTNMCSPPCNSVSAVNGPNYNMKGIWGSSLGLVIAVGETTSGGGTIVRGSLAP